MKSAPVPSNETERLDALGRYDVLDTLPELAYDDLALLASQICGTPIALISLLDESRQWFKARVGLDADQTPRDVAFCAHAILQPRELMVVSDATLDERFADNPLVSEDPGIRFYAGAPLVTPDGLPLGTICAIDRVPRELTDVQHRALEALSRQVMSLLELRATNRRLQRQQVALEELRREQLESKDRFLSQVSHELRTPIAAADQFVSIVLDGIAGEINAEQREYLSHAARNVGELTRLVSDLMDSVRGVSDKLRVERRRVELDDAIPHVLAAKSAAADAKGIEVRARVDPALPAVLADRTRVEQVLRNLVENAIKFTAAGGSIGVTARRDPDEPAFVRIGVEDSGCGMSEEDVARVFERHYQVAGDHSDSRAGLGLGLSICREIVSLHEGEIWVDSVPGAGSAFHFTLPILSMADILGPVLRDGDSLRDVCCVIRVAIVTGTGRSPSESLSRRAHHAVSELVYNPHLDVLLPRLLVSEVGSVFYVVAATDERGLAAMTTRLRRYLNGADAGLHGSRVDVVGRSLPLKPPAAGESFEIAADRAAAEIESIILDGDWSQA